VSRLVGADRRRPPALVVLADGTVFEGEAAGALVDGAVTVATGELVFNTALSGYQEVVTDPSYAGQVISFTYPHIGNYGTHAADDEAARPFCRGVVVRDLTPEPSNWQSTEGFEDFLVRHRLGAVTGVDTRRLTRHLRDRGAMPCAFGTAGEAELRAAARAEPGTDGRDLVGEVTTARPYTVGQGPWRVVALDFGVKTTMLRQLGAMATVTVMPAHTPPAEILERTPDGVFLSNGPGDPAALAGPTATVAELVGRVPVFGICLGHQVLASALGGRTYKLPFGHHGSNHPVRRLATGRVEVTSQNHNYAVAADSLASCQVTHVNLNDGVVEGIACPDRRAFSVQYHPEAGPGPHDARYLFEEFSALMAGSTGRG
jgi:carbamoyl-phosphate synthase small subunit